MFRLIFVLFILLLFQGASIRKDEDWCKTMNKKSVDYIFNFQIKGDSAYLDSALVCTNIALEGCSNLKVVLSYRKLDILSKKRKFSDAIYFLKSFDNPLLADLPYYNNFLLYRYKAMDYHSKGDIVNRNKCLKAIMDEVQQFILLNNDKMDSLYHSEDIKNILQNPLHFAPIQYYYSKSILYGSDNIKRELDSLQSTKKINKEYINYMYVCMYNDFMDFVGY